MTAKQVFRLVTPMARRAAYQAVHSAADGMVVEIKPATRSLDQNALLHKLFDDVSKQCMFHRRKLTPIQWKTIFISAHASATGIGADVIAGIEGEFVDIRESSARMSIARMSSLIEYIFAWCAENKVVTQPEEEHV